MFDSKTSFVKITGYIIMGFLTLIIIISFGMPDFISRMGLDHNSIADVNGESIQYMEYLRYRDNFAQQHNLKDLNNKEMQKYLINGLIENKLQTQKARELKIQVSDKKVRNIIKNNFTDKSGQFNNDYYERNLKHYQLSKAEYHFWVRDIMINREMMKMIEDGISVSPDEIITENAVNKSQLQIKYCFVSQKDLKKRYQNTIVVYDNDINDELKKNKGEVKDPKTDRERIKAMIEDRKFEKIKKDIIDDIDKMSMGGATFEQAAAKLNGKIGISKDFKVGEMIRENKDKGNIISAISDSRLFRDEFFTIASGKSSKVINNPDGIYIFTPIKKNIKMEEPSLKDKNEIESKIHQEKFNALYYEMMTAFKEKSRIRRNVNFQ